MPPQAHKKSGGAKKYGRNREKCERYRRRQTRERNKIKRILKSNGVRAAAKYARIHHVPLP